MELRVIAAFNLRHLRKKIRILRAPHSLNSVMKRHAIVLSVLAFFLIAAAHAQVFTVLKVSGHVDSPNLKRALKEGDKINASDQLKFPNKDAYIIVTSAKTGTPCTMSAKVPCFNSPAAYASA